MSSFLDFFNVTIGTITESKHSLIEIKSSLTILETLVLMRENNISVVPVYEPPSSMSTVQYVSQGKEYIGLISLNDIVTFIINVYLNEAERIDDCFSTSVYEILGVTTESSIDRPLSIESENTPLSSVIDKLCQGMHRCLVFDGTNHHRFTPKMLTQTDVVKYFVQNIDVFTEIQNALSLTVSSVMTDELIVSINEETLFVDGLKHFKTHTAIPVVNEWGQVVANFSTTDLKSIPVETTFDWRSYGTMTVKEFLSDESTGQYKQPAVCITSEGTLFTAAKYMIDHHIHRVWVTSPTEVSGVQGFGLGCLSLTDVIRVVSTYSTMNSTTNATA